MILKMPNNSNAQLIPNESPSIKPNIKSKQQIKEKFNFECKKKQLNLLTSAITKLNSDIDNNKLKYINFNSKIKRKDIDYPLTYYISEGLQFTYTAYTYKRIDIETYHFIGFYETNITINDNASQKVTIEIIPKWGDSLRNYLLQYAFGIHIPQNAASRAGESSNSSEWLLALLWKCSFDKALRLSHIPREYRSVEHNTRYFRGRMNVYKHIHNNLVDQSRFYCNYSPLTMDITINRTVRYVHKLLGNKFGQLLRDVSAYDEKLAAFGVKDEAVDINEIDSIVYTRMNENYRQLMELSKPIIRRSGAGSQNHKFEGLSYFIDISEIWENYLYKIIKSPLEKKGYIVSSPNYTGGDYLFDNMRQIRPDFLISKDNKIVAVLDAKYKNYSALGATEKEGVSREDLYQMATYLHHYNAKIGLFLTPAGNNYAAPRVYKLRNHDQHIGVLNMPIEDIKINDIKGVRKLEGDFIESLKYVLDPNKNHKYTQLKG